jgi:hypothetical protein
VKNEVNKTREDAEEHSGEQKEVEDMEQKFCNK